MEDFFGGLIAFLLVAGVGYFIYTRIQKSKERKSGFKGGVGHLPNDDMGPKPRKNRK